MGPFFPLLPLKDQFFPFSFKGPIYTDHSFFASNYGRDKIMFSNASQMPKLCTMKFTLKLFKIFENVTAGFNLYCVMLNNLKLSSAGVHKIRSLVSKAPKLNLSQVIQTVSQIMQNNLSLTLLELTSENDVDSWGEHIVPYPMETIKTKKNIFYTF